MKLTLSVLWDPHLTSANQRLHWAERARRNKRAKWRAREAWEKSGSAKATGRVRVTLTVRRAKALDGDNLISGCKPIIDGIFKDGVTPDDSAKWVALQTPQQEIAARWKGLEHVLVTIESEGDDGQTDVGR